MSEKRCPRCGREMPEFAVSCPCGFNYADPKRNPPYHPEEEEAQRIHKGELKAELKQLLSLIIFIVLLFLLHFVAALVFPVLPPVVDVILVVLLVVVGVPMLVITAVSNKLDKTSSSNLNSPTPPANEDAPSAPTDPPVSPPPQAETEEHHEP